MPLNGKKPFEGMSWSVFWKTYFPVLNSQDVFRLIETMYAENRPLFDEYAQPELEHSLSWVRKVILEETYDSPEERISVLELALMSFLVGNFAQTGALQACVHEVVRLRKDAQKPSGPAKLFGGGISPN